MRDKKTIKFKYQHAMPQVLSFPMSLKKLTKFTNTPPSTSDRWIALGTEKTEYH